MTYNLELFNDVIEVKTIFSRRDIVPGIILQFVYDGKERFAIVLNPDWQQKMHALQLDAISPVQLIELLQQLQGMVDPIQIDGLYRTSGYVIERPYRTFSINKISQIRQIFLKNPEMELDINRDKKLEVSELKTMQKYIDEEMNNV